MATVEELKKLVRQNLDSRGVTQELKARIRSEVFNALEDKTLTKPPLSNENLMINELIREYLSFNKYKYSESVLVAESGHPAVPLDREFLSHELNVQSKDNANKLPLLYSLVHYYSQRNPSNRGDSTKK